MSSYSVTTTIEGTVIRTFTCAHCGLVSLASVEVTGSSMGGFFSSFGSGKERLHEAARSDAATRADAMVEAARCPKCGQRNEAAYEGLRETALTSASQWSIAIAIGAGGISLVIGQVVVAVIGVVVAAFAYFVAHSQASQEVEEVDLRVHVLSEEEALEVIAQIDGEGDDASRIVAPVWVETGDDVVTWPFSCSVRMGLVEVDDNTCAWVSPADLGDTPKVEALAHAIAGLWSLSRGPFVKEATGVWRGRFGDGLAAARLFLPGFTAKCDVAGTQVVFTSTEDTFIVTGTDDHEALRVACDLARGDACAVKLVGSNVDVFTATPWLLKDGAWTPWETPPLVLQGPLSALRQEVER